MKIQESYITKHKLFRYISFLTSIALLATLTISGTSIFHNQVNAAQVTSIGVSNWWPVSESSVNGQQPFKGILNGWNINDYAMYWSVDDGSHNLMISNFTDYPHKQSIVDVSDWNWKDNGRYRIAFIAKSLSGSEISRTSFVVNIPQQKPATTLISPQTFITTPATPTLVALSAPRLLEKETLYALPDSNASQQVAAWKSTRPQDAAQLDKIAGKSTAVWFGGWNTDVQAEVNQLVSLSANESKLPVMVAYNIPGRDCGGYSGGGVSEGEYISWISKFAAGIADRKTLVVLEPDSVANIDCLSDSAKKTRLSLLAQAVTILKANPSTYVYLDGGNPEWVNSDTMARRLTEANVKTADGFALNISNFITTADNEKYGTDISTKLQGKHFVIDTSRNGRGATADLQWCNPEGRALGNPPSTSTTNALVDAYLWIKAPGESDGSCNGAPQAGVWWPEYALKLAQNTP